jgi:hypothetical protein
MFRILFIATYFGLVTHSTWADEPARLRHRWELEPALGASWHNTYGTPAIVLQPERLKSDVQEVRLSEAQSIVRHARSPQLKGAAEALPVLLELLKTPAENRALRLTLAAAAIQLSTVENAALLWERLSPDAATRPLIERALVDWQSPLALELWRKRLLEGQTPQSDLLLALEGIGASGSQQDRTALESVLRDDRTSIPCKFVAVRALARVSPTDLEQLAQQILASDIDHHELLAASLLTHHTSNKAREILAGILNSDNISAHAVAYAAIAENFPTAARELAADMLQRPDNTIRATAVEVLNRFNDGASLRLQAANIADSNIHIRNTVRQNLLDKATIPELRIVVDEVITHFLTSEGFQEVEQTILLVVDLRETNRCPQLMALLQHPRIEVSMTAAWGLQELADTPEVAAGIFSFAQQITQRLATSHVVTFPEILRQAFLLEALGRMEYKPAVDMLKIYVPKNGHKMGDVARASAIWALGKILRNSQDAQLAKQLALRMLDPSDMDPEDELVKFTSALALGWIGAPASRAELESVISLPPVPLALARDWSLQQFPDAATEANAASTSQ